MKISMNMLSLALLAMTEVTADEPHGTRLGSQRRTTDLSRHSATEKAETADRRGGCFDVIGWYDFYGEEFNCDWYGNFDGACSDFGADNEFANFGYTANTACCACGGGSSDLSPRSSYEKHHSPIWKSACSDVVGWYDSYGPTFNCDYYEENDICSSDGHLYANMGHTADSACCTCGGVDVGECSDVEWIDSNGNGCDWYEHTLENGCNRYGSDFENEGRTAHSACCACGGGCFDVAGWYDSDGPTYNCEWYAEAATNCATYGSDFTNFGHTANTACCACKGY